MKNVIELFWRKALIIIIIILAIVAAVFVYKDKYGKDKIIPQEHYTDFVRNHLGFTINNPNLNFNCDASHLKENNSDYNNNLYSILCIDSPKQSLHSLIGYADVKTDRKKIIDSMSNQYVMAHQLVDPSKWNVNCNIVDNNNTDCVINYKKTETVVVENKNKDKKSKAKSQTETKEVDSQYHFSVYYFNSSVDKNVENFLAVFGDSADSKPVVKSKIGEMVNNINMGGDTEKVSLIDNNDNKKLYVSILSLFVDKAEAQTTACVIPSIYKGSNSVSVPFSASSIINNTINPSYFTVPAGVTDMNVLLVGAGGGGGGTRGSGDNRAGGGGASGGCIQETLNVIPGRIFRIIVGKGGDSGSFTYNNSIICDPNNRSMNTPTTPWNGLAGNYTQITDNINTSLSVSGGGGGCGSGSGGLYQTGGSTGDSSCTTISTPGSPNGVSGSLGGNRNNYPPNTGGDNGTGYGKGGNSNGGWDGSKYTCQTNGGDGVVIISYNRPTNTASAALTNTAPAAPTITGAASTIMGTTYNMTLRTTDTQNDSVVYNVNWGDSTSGTAPSSGYVTTTSLTSAGHIYNTLGTYTISVTATDNNANPLTSTASTLSVVVTNNCSAGQYYNGQYSTCSTCPSGTYGANPPGVDISPNATVCPVCPVNTYSTAGSSSCNVCPAGQTSPSGSTSASSCNIAPTAPTITGATYIPINTSYNMTLTTTDTDQVRYNVNWGDNTSGTAPSWILYTTASDQTPAGHTYTTTGTKTISVTATDNNASPLTSTSSTKTIIGYDCSAGRYYNTQNSTCTICPNGTYGTTPPGAASSVNVSVCPVCPAGTYTQGQTGQVSCTSCPAGMYGTTGNSCASCPVNTYSIAGSSSCTACLAGQTSPQGASVCTSPIPAPIITGATNKVINTTYNIVISTTDSTDNIVDYNINWGDGTSGTISGVSSLEYTPAGHIYSTIGTYTISVSTRYSINSSPYNNSTPLTSGTSTLGVSAVSFCSYNGFTCCPIGQYSNSGYAPCTPCPSQYLTAGQAATSSTACIVDRDSNGLIEIFNLFDFNNINNNLLGTSYIISSTSSGNIFSNFIDVTNMTNGQIQVWPKASSVSLFCRNNSCNLSLPANINTAGTLQTISGGNGSDSVYINPGAQVDAIGLFASAGNDKLYLTGNFADYTQTVSAWGVYTFTGKAGTKNAGEVVSFSLNGDACVGDAGDTLIFADRGGNVCRNNYSNNSNNYNHSLIQAVDLSATMITPNPLPQISMPIQALYNSIYNGSRVYITPENASTRTFISSPNGISFTVPIILTATTSATLSGRPSYPLQIIEGSSMSDSVYVNPGAQVNAIGLFASAGNDKLYLTGNFADYTQTVSAGGVYTFTGKAGTKNAGEVVSFALSQADADYIIFADRGGLVRLSDYSNNLTGYTYLLIQAGDLSANMTSRLGFTGGCPNNVCRGYELANNISFFPAPVISSMGNNWTQTNQRTGNFNSFIATGTELIAGSNGSGIYKSLDGGQTWNRTNVTIGTFYSFLNTGTKLITGGGSSGGLYTSTDGSNWTSTGYTGITLQSLTIGFLSFLDTGTRLLAGTNGDGIYKSIDRGNTWTPTNKRSGAFVSLLNTGTQILAGSTGNNPTGIWISADGGNSWTQTSKTTGIVEAFLNTGTQILAGTNNGIWISKDGGYTWNKATNTPDVRIGSLVNTGTQLLAAAGSFGGGDIGIYKSTDGGNSWSRTAQTTGTFNAFLNTGTKILAGSTVGIWKSSN